MCGNTSTDFVGEHSNNTTVTFHSKIHLKHLLYYIRCYAILSKELKVNLSKSMLIYIFCFIKKQSYLSHAVWPRWNFFTSIIFANTIVQGYSKGCLPPLKWVSIWFFLRYPMSFIIYRNLIKSEIFFSLCNCNA